MGLASGGGSGADLARSRAGSRGDRPRRRRRPDQAEGLHRAQERLRRRGRFGGRVARAREGARGTLEISALGRLSPGPAAHPDRKDSALQAARLIQGLVWDAAGPLRQGAIEERPGTQPLLEHDTTALRRAGDFERRNGGGLGRPHDAVERKPLAGIERDETSRIRIPVVRARVQDIEVVEILGPMGPIGRVGGIDRIGGLDQRLHRRRRPVLGVDARAILIANMEDLLADHCESRRHQSGALDHGGAGGVHQP